MIQHCSLCSFSAKYQSQVNLHGLYKHFYCVPCNDKCETFEAILDHQKEAHDQDFTCNICSKRFLETGRLTSHINEKHCNVTREKIHSCEFCEFKTDVIAKLDEHTKAVHHVKKDIQCHICDFKTGWQRSIDLHIKYLHEKSSLPKLACSQCHFVTLSQSSLRNHQKGHEVPKENIKCEHCGKDYPTLTEVNRHVKVIHSNNVKCEICDKTCYNPKRLWLHKVLSHNADAWRCEKCPRKQRAVFQTQATYEKHMKKFHYF